MQKNGFYFWLAALVLFIPACGGSNTGSSKTTTEGSAVTASREDNASAGATAAAGEDIAGDQGGAAVTPTPPGSSGGDQAVPSDPGAAPSPASATWAPLAPPVHSGQALSLSMATAGGVPYVAWEESGKVFVAHWDGTQWKTDGSRNRNPSHAASVPALAADGEALYLSWVEARAFYLEKREGGTWTPVASRAGTFDCSPGNVDLAVHQGVATVASDTFCADSMYVSTAVEQWAGAWVSQGGVGAHYGESPYHRKYELRSDPNGLYLAGVTENRSMEGTELQLFHRTADEWTLQGERPNDPFLFTPAAFSLALIKGKPYLAMHQGGLEVKQWSGEGWAAVGSVIPAAAVDPYLVGIGETPYLIFAAPGSAAGTRSVQVSFWDGNAWTAKGGPLNQEKSDEVETASLSLASTGAALYAAWIEGGSIQVRSIPLK